MSLDEVSKNIVSCLNSVKGRIQLRTLERDYREIIGDRIPYRQFGYNSLEEFLQSIPSIYVTKNAAGEVFVDAQVSQKSAHITEMVAKQKTSKKSAPKAVRFTKPFVNQPQRWRPKNVAYTPNKWKSSLRPQYVSHNQQITKTPPNKSILVPSKVVVPQNVNYNPVNFNQNDNVTRIRPSVQNRLQQHQKIISNHVMNDVTPNNTQNHTNDINPLMNARRRINLKMSELSLEKENVTQNHVAPASPVWKNYVEPALPAGKILPNIEPALPVGKILPDIEPVLSVGKILPDVEPSTPVRRRLADNQEIKKKFVATGEPLKDLKSFTDMYELGEPEISTKLISKGKIWTCKITVGSHTYHSYPEELTTDVAARIFTAEIALKDLIDKYEKTERKSLLISSEEDILQRIPPMLMAHHHGLWMSQLKLDYVDKFNEQLPDDFLKIIDRSPNIQVEKVHEDYVLRHCKPGDVVQKGKCILQMTTPMVSVPSNTVRFGEDGRLYALVTCVISANEVWCRQCNTEESELYTEMNARLDIFYGGREDTLRATDVIKGGYYVGKFDDSFYRVRVVDVTGKEVNCFFIDFGDEIMISMQDIYEMRREFAVAEAQAFVCHLVGLEELYEVSTHSETIQKLLYKQVVLELASENPVLDTYMDSSIPVVMYDYETQKSINEELIPQLMMESAAPLIKEETINEVYVSNIESNGDVYVQMHSPGFECLQEMILNIEAQITENPPDHLLGPITPENSKNKRYLGKYDLDGHWYRLELIDWSPDHPYAQTYFIDYGNTGIFNAKKQILYPIEGLSDVLNQYPAQAVKVRIDLPEIAENFMETAKKAMPEDVPVILKVRGVDDEGVYKVEFFKRSEHEDGVISINKSIEFETEQQKGKSNSKVAKKRGNQSYPSAGILPPPSLPKTNNYFRVHVPFAVNPYNFFVQPLEQKGELYKMMEKLQDEYKDVQFSPLTIDDIVPGKIYASKHEDGIWYRTSVIKVIHSGSISVFYCDFGYYANLTVQQLIPLNKEFMELPYQAIKAKLTDIKPLQNKWTMEDCEYFKNLVQKKNLYSVLIAIERDILYESDMVLKLLLIDTSGDKDVYIGKELIKRGIAVEA